MNIAIIFAAGKGKRMGKTEKPKQFLEIKNKPVIVHTLNAFQSSKYIDKIIVVTLKDWIDYTWRLIKKYNLDKVEEIVQGGETGQMSIFNGLQYAYENFDRNSIILINDGVRPFISDELIKKNIESVKKYGSAVSTVYSTETVTIIDKNNKIKEIPDRNVCAFAKAPQSFILKNLYEIHMQAQNDGIINSIDSATLMSTYEKELYTVLTDYDNIKITTIKDISLAESIYERQHINK